MSTGITDTLVALYTSGLCGLSPFTIDIDDQTTKHFWTANHRRFNKPGWFWFSVYDLSYGGLVAYRMAEMYPEMVEKVVIVSSGVVWTDEQKDELMMLSSGFLEHLVAKRADSNLTILTQRHFGPKAKLERIKDTGHYGWARYGITLDEGYPDVNPE
ncbi:PREDICTED: 2-hydroxy-6-oxononadienedioate/2-hydroxy-6-oxononatrienedioate hydrolase [Prunus dulcis]|uniref:PREDICTED: 2-hydroxy-6-oxononadienedioate/2-hydroxy-6-oxononatrienedioate hydrolase n=1 Tax=Prunus dulcis TaxID=3755 RepID=A0A5E4EYA5_PRUDU|nr:PREDICTED: 2-hydroxy-6-oxononadienedioate/2-hydroxy-6-oxononatrienedioate hydrolase [Prunus dulcis]